MFSNVDDDDEGVIPRAEPDEMMRWESTREEVQFEYLNVEVPGTRIEIPIDFIPIPTTTVGGSTVHIALVISHIRLLIHP